MCGIDSFEIHTRVITRSQNKTWLVALHVCHMASWAVLSYGLVRLDYSPECMNGWRRVRTKVYILSEKTFLTLSASYTKQSKIPNVVHKSQRAVFLWSFFKELERFSPHSLYLHEKSTKTRPFVFHWRKTGHAHSKTWRWVNNDIIS